MINLGLDIKTKTMFKKSKDGTQQDIFTSIPSMLRGSSYEQYNNPKAWHNQFRAQIVERVNEMIFKPLYDEAMGAPNASTRVLVGMLTLKEGFGWSDNELFEQCSFNLLVRSALGLFNITDNLPAPSTYYLFRKRILDYQRENDVDIIELAFQQITRGQIIDYHVSGRSIRMDSKLIGSNIAWCSRYELVHNTLSLFYKSLSGSVRHRLARDLYFQLKEISETESGKIVYHNNREEVQEKLKSLGSLIYKLLSVLREKDSDHYNTLKRLFEEQYRVNTESQQVELRPKEELHSGTIQSPHDTDCAYRNKDNRPVKGYSTNVTETCDDDSLNLIVDAHVSPVNASENEFFQPAIDQAATVIGHKVEDVHADGAYQSHDNVQYCQQENINPYFTGIQGTAGRYDLILTEETLVVVDLHTGEIMPVNKLKSGKWAMKAEKGKYRYFSKKDAEVCKLRKQIAAMPPEKRNKRNNIEATIFQLSYFTRNNKTRYRGLYQNSMWATLRCMWINLRRISAYMEQYCQKAFKSGNLRGQMSAFRTALAGFCQLVKNIRLQPPLSEVLFYKPQKYHFKKMYLLE